MSMSIKCVVCGEPYEACGLHKGGGVMFDWEVELFLKGAGCPCCEGEMPEKEEDQYHPETMEDIGNGDGDPIDRLHLYQDRDKRPEWRRPDPKVLWTCAGCGVNVVENPDNGELEYDLPFKAKGAQWYHSHPYSQGCPEREPAHVFKPDQPVCEFCLKHCDGCGEPISDILEYGDVYDDGYCGTLEAYGYTDLFCIDCLESSCCVCRSLPKDCDCCRECDKSADECECYCKDCGELKNECSCFDSCNEDEEDEDA